MLQRSRRCCNAFSAAAVDQPVSAAPRRIGASAHGAPPEDPGCTSRRQLRLGRQHGGLTAVRRGEPLVCWFCGGELACSRCERPNFEGMAKSRCSTGLARGIARRSNRGVCFDVAERIFSCKQRDASVGFREMSHGLSDSETLRSEAKKSFPKKATLEFWI